MKHLTFIMAASLALLPAVATAQGDGVTVKVGITLPTSIGSDADNTAMGTGFAFVLRASSSLKSSRWGYFVDLGMGHNGASSDADASNRQIKETYDDLYGYNDENSTSSMSTSAYWHFPVIAGLNYCFPVGETISLYGEAGVGIAFWKITEQTYDGHKYWEKSGTVAGHHYNNSLDKTTHNVLTYALSVQGVAHLGIGATIGSHLQVGAAYDWHYGANTVTIDNSTVTVQNASGNVTTKTDHPDPEKVTGDAAATPMFSLYAGWRF